MGLQLAEKIRQVLPGHFVSFCIANEEQLSTISPLAAALAPLYPGPQITAISPSYKQQSLIGLKHRLAS